MIPGLPPVLCPRAIARVVGEICEERVADVLTRADMPAWFLWARHATSHEDRELGFDLVVHTRDVGRILLNVKASKAGVAEFEARARWVNYPYHVHAVRVRPDTPREVVLGRVLAVCILAREEAFAGRCLADHWSLNRLARAA